MTRFEGKVAAITGGASGIGLALAKALAQRGAKVMLLDVEAAALEAALGELRREGSNADVRGLVCDVSAREATAQAAREVAEAFGRVDLVFANAGVGGVGGGVHTLSDPDWRWVLGVNVLGMIHTVDAFLPQILAGGEGGHVVYTASMAGLLAPPNMGAYVASKFATVAMAEVLAAEQAGSGVGVSVLCPGFVSTRIHESHRNRPAGLASERAEADPMGVAAQLVISGIAPAVVAERVLEAIAAGEFYIFTHPDMRDFVEARFDRIRAGFDAAARSPVLAGPPPS